MRDAMEKILRQGSVPKNLQTDAGKEFYNHLFKSLMQKYSINHYSTYSVIKASIVERVIRTSKNKLYKAFSLHGKYNWYGILSDITLQYNYTKHRTIGMKPKDVTPKEESLLLMSTYNRPKVVGKKILALSDIVHISKCKSTFAKGYTPNWSTELFKIVKVQFTSLATYLLEDMKGKPIVGSFCEQELQKMKHKGVYLVEKIVRRNGNKVLVKWLGLLHEQNSWIDKKVLCSVTYSSYIL
ncbi:hypothetical protein Trydic_g8347 [Trypoxylus dichotomus]